MVVYPEQTFPPIKKDNCQGGESLVRNVGCIVIQNIVIAKQLPFKDDASGSPKSELPVGSKIQFTIRNSQNPKSARETSVYKIYLKDKDGYIKSEMAEPNRKAMKLTMTEPSLILTG
jgi:hypothetical protein